MDDKTGGPAFPVIGIREIHGQPMQHVLAGGMTLLDYFAGRAMPLCTNTNDTKAAEWCYDRAAAMLKEKGWRK